MSEDLHIAILRFGRNKLQEGITFDELQKHISDSGYDVNNDRLEGYFWVNYETLNREERASPLEASNKGSKFSLTVESTFPLIEFEEFQSANRSSRTATWFASAALVVSIISLWISVYFSSKQLDLSSKIDQSQLDRILQIKFDDDEVIRKLDEIIEVQRSAQKNGISRDTIPNNTPTAEQRVDE